MSEPAASGFITAYPTGTVPPMVAHVSFASGQTISNQVIVRTGTTGAVSFLNNSAGSTRVAIEVMGYYVAGPPAVPGAFFPLNASRVLDTRVGTGAPAGPLAGQAALDVVVAGW